MSVTRRLIDTTPERVWDVLADGWLYPLWVVGASRMRNVDEAWPDAGAKIHHSVGVWPALIDDHTAVVESEPGRRLVLRARAWPVGEAKVDITLQASGAGTEVTVTEDLTSGPAALVPEPLRGLGLRWRNVETLRRLAFIAENRASS